MNHDDLVQAIERHIGPIIVDLDETLYLRNSSQEFIDVAAPRTLATFVIRLLQLLKPWRLTGRDTADCWRVATIALLFPWTFAIWKRHVAITADAQTNAALLQTLSGRETDVIIATLGFGPVVRPLIAAMGFASVPVVACRLGGFADRRRGKLAMLDAAIGRKNVQQALVITDSEHDRPLLDMCATPALIVWHDARYYRGLSRPCLPFDYVSLVKRPGKSAAKAIFMEDFATWAIATLPFLILDWRNALALPLLFVSFWSVYETGYAENDRVAAEREADPVLSASFDPDILNGFEPRAWIFATGFGLSGCALLSSTGDLAIGWYIGRWAAVLLGLRATYGLYNRLDKQTRIWLYAPLQIFRAAAFATVMPLETVGMTFCAALALSRWISYYFYRLTKTSDASALWESIPQRFVRLWLLLMMTPFVAMTAPAVRPVVGVSALLGLGWYMLLGRQHLIKVARGARWLRRRPRHPDEIGSTAADPVR